MQVRLLQSCPTLCDPVNCSPPGSSVRGILQSRILEWVATSFSRVSSQPRNRCQVSHIAGGFFISICCYCLVAKSCQTLCNPMNCSLPGFSVHGILQARILKWVDISFSRGSSQPRDQTHVSCLGRRSLYHWANREALSGIFLSLKKWNNAICSSMDGPRDYHIERRTLEEDIYHWHIPHGLTYMWSLQHNTNERWNRNSLTGKESRLWLPSWRRVGRGQLGVWS